MRPAAAVIFALVVLTFLSPTGCGRGSDASALEHFRTRWLDAVNRNQFDRLYDLLDAGSQRRVSHDLEVLRGLTPREQQTVIDQLGGTRIPDLSALSPADYFALLWARATEGHRPTLTVEATGADAAYMELTIEGQPPQRIRLSLEAGRWVWHLPEQNL